MNRKLTRRFLLQSLAAASAAGTAAQAAGVAVRGASAPEATKAPVGPPTAVSMASSGGSARQRRALDSGWRFAFGHANDPLRDFGYAQTQSGHAKAGVNLALATAKDFDDHGWRELDLPHDWAVELPFVQGAGNKSEAAPASLVDHGSKPLGRQFPETSIGWYRRSFEVDAADLGQRFIIEFDGVFRDCEVFCNGYLAGAHVGGYAPFSVDVTEFLDYGAPNVLAVRVDATQGEGWFYEGAGIYRHVWLHRLPAAHFTLHGCWARAATLTPQSAVLQMSAELLNDSDAPLNGAVLFQVLRPDGSEAAVMRTAVRDLGGSRTQEYSAEVNLPDTVLWSLDHPALYSLRCRLLDNAGIVVDEERCSFGLRSARFDAERGFLLNGERLTLKGTCNHTDHAGVGNAVPDGLLEWRLRQLKEMGCNAYRTSHGAPPAELATLCDQLGMLLVAETRAMSSEPEALADLRALLRRDRGHPSVIGWSIGNEEPQQGSERGARIARRMQALVRELDPTRPTLLAMDNDFGKGAGAIVDVVGFNYRTDKMGEFHEANPARPLVGTETGSTVCTRGIYVHDEAAGYLSCYDREHPWWATTAQEWWDYAERRPYIAGGFVWTGFDYRGEPTPFNRWPSISSHFGILDTCGFPKDNFYYYQARWLDQPVLHLLPHWNWRPGAEVEVWAHTNLERVELFLNGRSLGIRELQRNGHVEWKVPFKAGVLEARGYKGGRRVATDRRITAGPAAALRLSANATQLHANGTDVAVVAVQVVDAHGVLVPRADNLVSFAVEGPGRIIGVGNGNPTSLEADKASQRRAFNGLCQLILQSGTAAGSLRLKAMSDALKSGQAELDVS